MKLFCKLNEQGSTIATARWLDRQKGIMIQEELKMGIVIWN